MKQAEATLIAGIATACASTAIGLAAIIFSWLNTRRTLSENRKSQEELQRLQLDARIGDWYIKAIEQLPSMLVDIRIGAVFALQRVAKLSVDDQDAVIGVLCAFISEKTHALPSAPEGGASLPDRSVVVAMQVLAELPHPHSSPLILSGIRVPRLVLRDRALLSGAELAGVDLTGATMNKAQLQQAVMRKAYCLRIQLTGANAAGLQAEDATFESAEMKDCVLEGANLRKAKLYNAHLASAQLQGADLRSANLKAADLRGANLINAKLGGAFLDAADLRGAKFGDTEFNEHTSFTKAQLDKVRPDGLIGPADRLADASITETGHS